MVSEVLRKEGRMGEKNLQFRTTALYVVRLFYPTLWVLDCTYYSNTKIILNETFIIFVASLAQGSALPFVFSPPSTRSRTRRKKSESFSEQSLLYEAQSIQETSQIAVSSR